MLVHHDFKPGNLNFTRAGESFEASGVFDLFEAYIGDPEEDLVRMLWEVETDDQRCQRRLKIEQVATAEN